MKPYVIATWPNGLRLTRPSFVLSLVLEINNQRLVRITFSPARLAVQDRSVPPRGGVRVLLTGAGREDHSLLTDEVNRALIWVLHEVMRVPGHKIAASRAVSIPGVYRSEMLIDTLLGDLRGIENAPPAMRSDLWKWTTDRFLRGAGSLPFGPSPKYQTGSRELAGNLAGTISWAKVGGTKTMRMHVPSIQDIGLGQTPSWSIDNSEDVQIARSDESPYDVLLKAEIIASDEDHATWMAEHGSPGILTGELETYRLLGLTIPPLMGSIDFREWSEGGGLG